MLYRTLFALALLMVGIPSASPVFAVDAVQMLDKLKEVWYNTVSVTDKVKTDSEMTAILNWNFEDVQKEISKQESGGGASVSIPLPVLKEVFDLGLKADFSKKSNWQKEHKVKEALYDFSASRNSTDVLRTLYMRTASREALELWKAWLEAQDPLKTTLGGDPLGDFSITVDWSPRQSPAFAKSIKVTDIAMSNATLLKKPRFPVIVSSAPKTFSFRRTNLDNKGFISVNTDVGQFPFHLASKPAPEPASPPPVVITPPQRYLFPVDSNHFRLLAGKSATVSTNLTGSEQREVSIKLIDESGVMLHNWNNLLEVHRASLVDKRISADRSRDTPFEFKYFFKTSRPDGRGYSTVPWRESTNARLLTDTPDRLVYELDNGCQTRITIRYDAE